VSLVCADGQEVVTVSWTICGSVTDPADEYRSCTQLLTIRLSRVNAPIRESLVIPF